MRNQPNQPNTNPNPNELQYAEDAIVNDIVTHWCVNVAVLMQLGELQDDDMNGFFSV